MEEVVENEQSAGTPKGRGCSNAVDRTRGDCRRSSEIVDHCEIATADELLMMMPGNAKQVVRT